MLFYLIILAAAAALVWPVRRLWIGGRRATALLLPLLLLAIALPFAPVKKPPTPAQRALQHYYAGLDQQQRGDLDAAAEQFRRVLELDPEMQKAREAMARLEEERRPQRRVSEGRVEVDPGAGQAAPAEKPPAPAAPAHEKRPPLIPHIPSPFEITDYRLNLRLQPDRHALEAIAQISLRMRSDAGQDLPFSLSPQFPPYSCRIDGAPVQWRHRDDLLLLALPGPLKQGGRHRVEISYRRKGGAATPAGDIVGAKAFFLRAESRWYPAAGEFDFQAPVAVTAAVPQSLTLLAPGRLLRRRTVEGGMTEWSWKSSEPCGMVAIAGGDLRPSPADGGRVAVYMPPGRRALAQKIAAEAVRIRNFYSRLYGPYPYPQLKIVTVPRFPGGYGAPSLVMLGRELLPHLDAGMRSELLAHEIAHQWWGHKLLPQGPGAGWLSEAFATYSSWLYLESLGQKLQPRAETAIRRYLGGIREAGDQPLSETDPYVQAPSSQSIVYEKGAMVLRMLRHEIGSTRFFSLLRQLMDHGFRRLDLPGFRKEAAAVTGQDLDWFWDQWLDRPGAFDLSYAFRDLPGGRVELRVRQPAESAFRARVPVDLEAGDQVVRRTIRLTGAPEDRFELQAPGAVRSVVFDPESRLLMAAPRWRPEMDEPGPAPG